MIGVIIIPIIFVELSLTYKVSYTYAVDVFELCVNVFNYLLTINFNH